MAKTEENDYELGSNFTLLPDTSAINLKQSYMYFSHYYPTCEMNTKKWITDHVNVDWVCIDVGANIGYYSILFSRLAKKGFTHAIEPTATFELLQENLKSNEILNCKLYNIGISNENSTKSEKIFQIWGEAPIEKPFRFLELDVFIEENMINQVDLVKVDTDGFELEVLDGMKRCIEKFNPWLLIEFSYALNTRGYEVGELIDKLINLGYEDALLLDDNNLITKRNSSGVTKSWSKSLEIASHDYKIIFNKEKINILENEYGVSLEPRIKTFLDTDKNKFFELKSRLAEVKTLEIHDFISTFQADEGFFHFQKKYGVNPISKSRGPRMEVNDAPYLRAIYRNMQPNHHLEFGTWEGFGASIFCEEVALGEVTTINLQEGEILPGRNVAAYGSSYYPEERKKFLNNDFPNSSDSGESIGWVYRKKGFSNRVQQVYGSTFDIDPVKLGESHFDSVLIDGDHSREGVINDSRLALKVVNQNPIIMWHDFTLNFEDFQNYTSVKGVVAGICEIEKEFSDEGYSFYWIKDTWILFARKDV